MVGEGFEEEQIEYASRVTETKYTTKENGTRVRSTIHLLSYLLNDMRMDDVPKMFCLVKSLKEEPPGTGKLMIAVAGTRIPEYLRKCVKYVFHNTSKETVILDPRGKPRERNQTAVATTLNRKQKEKVIVKVRGKIIC